MNNIISDLKNTSLERWISTTANRDDRLEKNSPLNQAKQPFITISRNYGVTATEVAEYIKEKLNKGENNHPLWKIYNNEIINEMKTSKGFLNYLDSKKGAIEEFIESIVLSNPTRSNLFTKLGNAVIKIAINGRAIILGRGGAILTSKLSGGLHVRLIDTFENRVNRTMILKSIDNIEDARKLVKKNENEREAFLKEYTGKATFEPLNYDIILNMNYLTVEQTGNIIISALNEKVNQGKYRSKSV